MGYYATIWLTGIVILAVAITAAVLIVRRTAR